MSYLREYIRYCFLEEGTQAYGEYPLNYNPTEVLNESIQLKSGFEDLVNENMELAYFNRDSKNSINGAAWILDNGKKFEFAVTTNEKAPDYVFENLIQDCMKEYIALKLENKNLVLEVKVEDDETESYLSETYGLKVLKQNEYIAIMGFES